MPIYRLIYLWNMLYDSMVSYKLSKFRVLVSSADELFLDFCSAFKYHAVIIYSAFEDM